MGGGVVDLLLALHRVAKRRSDDVDAAEHQFGNAGLVRDAALLERNAEMLGDGRASVDVEADDLARLRIREAERHDIRQGAADELAARLDVAEQIRMSGGDEPQEASPDHE